jgi:hypothetical protein
MDKVQFKELLIEYKGHNYGLLDIVLKSDQEANLLNIVQRDGTQAVLDYYKKLIQIQNEHVFCEGICSDNPKCKNSNNKQIVRLCLKESLYKILKAINSVLNVLENSADVKEAKSGLMKLRAKACEAIQNSDPGGLSEDMAIYDLENQNRAFYVFCLIEIRYSRNQLIEDFIQKMQNVRIGA